MKYIYIDILIVMLLLQVLDGKFKLAIKYFQAIDDLLKYTRLNGFKSYYWTFCLSIILSWSIFVYLARKDWKSRQDSCDFLNCSTEDKNYENRKIDAHLECHDTDICLKSKLFYTIIVKRKLLTFYNIHLLRHTHFILPGFVQVSWYLPIIHHIKQRSMDLHAKIIYVIFA